MGPTMWRWKGCSLLMGVLAMFVISLEAHTPSANSQPQQQPPSNQQPQKQPDDDLLDDEVTVEDEGVTMKLDDYEIEYKTPTPSEPVHFYETFDDVNRAKSRWISSLAQKEDNENVFKYDGKWEFDLPERRIFPNDRALVLRSKAKHAAISAKLDRKFEFNTKPLFVQYEVTFQNGMDCGGAYIKLLSDSKDMGLDSFHDKTPYTIMFGPDKCGSDIKLHFIFRHKNPLNGTFEEKHAKRPSNRMEDAFTDKKPHLYRLVLKPDNRFEVFVDGMLINQGDLLEDMEPPVNPPIEIEDPADSKPHDWDEREKIPDENALRPADWDDEAPPKIPDPNANVPTGWLEDEPEMVPDPSAVMPEDWDESMDGDWEAPLIPNPKCEEDVGCGLWQAPLVENPNFKGKWQAPLVENPDFKGKWARRLIPNPDYFEDKEPFKMTPIGAVGLEIWTMTDNVLFDNFIVSDKESVVNDFTEATYNLKMRALERDSRGVIERIINYSNSHPWLYAVYTIVIGLPVVLIIAFCCGGSTNQDKKSDAAAAAAAAYDDDDEDEDEDKEKPKRSTSSEPLLTKTSKNTVAQAPSPPAAAAAASPADVEGSSVKSRKNGAQSKDDLEQPAEEEEEKKKKEELKQKDEAEEEEDDEEEEEEEDDEGWVQTANPNSKQQTAAPSVNSNTTSKTASAPAKEEEEEEEEEDEEAEEEEEEEEEGNKSEEEEEEENSDDEEENNEEDASPPPEPVDELIPPKEENRENSQLKKRRTRRD